MAGGNFVPSGRLIALPVLFLAFFSCATILPGEMSRPVLSSLFLLTREELLARLPDDLRRDAVAGENEITVMKTLSRSVFNLSLPVKTEEAAYQFTHGKLTRIEIRIGSGSGALDPDLVDLRRLYHALDDDYRARLGPPAADTRETAPADDKNEGLTTVASAETSWNAGPGRAFLPALAVTLNYRERALQGLGTIRIREVYEWKGELR